MRSVLAALVLLTACGGNVVVDATTATDGGGSGSAPDAGFGGGAPDAGQVVDCAGTICMPGQICCSPAGPTLVCYTGTSCPP